MPQKRKNASVTESLRQAVVNSGQPLVQISKSTGIDLGNLSRFARGQRFLSAENLDRLCEHLGLVLVRPGGMGKLRRGVARLVLAGAIAASQANPGPVSDAFAALVSVGHRPAEAQRMIDAALASGNRFDSAADLLSAAYSLT